MLVVLWFCTNLSFHFHFHFHYIYRYLAFSYGITNSAYRSLQDQNENQCVCILGENGSGKTESARIILHFLSNVHSNHTLSANKILHNQNSTRLMRCKSLASYPKYESPEALCRSGTCDSIKFARKSHVSQLILRTWSLFSNKNSHFFLTFIFFFFLLNLYAQKSPGTVEFDLRNQYKSLDDVSLNSICGDNKWNTKFSNSLSSAINSMKANRSEKTECDKTPTRTKNVLIMKKDLQCDKCGYIKAICDDISTDSRCSKGTSCHLSDENFSTNYFNENATFKSTNCRLKSESTYSLSKSTSFNTSDIHSTIRRRFVYAQVLLEAFGNASTPLNSNSSRCVRFNWFANRWNSKIRNFHSLFFFCVCVLLCREAFST